jgi:hypothetical protein
MKVQGQVKPNARHVALAPKVIWYGFVTGLRYALFFPSRRPYEMMPLKSRALSFNIYHGTYGE